MTSIDCTDIKAILSPYIDDELDEQTRHLAERHLGECQHCRNLVDQAERLDALVAADIESTMPAGLSPDFFGSVMARTVYAEPHTVRFSGRRIATWTGWMAAAAAFALAGGIWIDQNMRSVPSSFSAGENVQVLPVDPQATDEVSSDATLRDDFYAAGIDLQSRTFEGALPAHAFRTVASRNPQTSAAVESPNVPDSSIASALPIADEESMTALMTPRAALVSTQSDRLNIGGASTVAFNVPTIGREDADALYSASILMHMLTAADARSFADVEHVRKVVEEDNLLPRLNEARDRLQPADRPAVFAAESVLTRVTQGPLDTNDVLSLRDTVAALDLSGELGEITDRWDRGSSL